MLRAEFGIGQLGKRLKILDAAREAAKKLPKEAPKPKSKPVAAAQAVVPAAKKKGKA